MLNCYPDNVSLHIVLPVEAERSLAIFAWYLPEKVHAAQPAKAADLNLSAVLEGQMPSRQPARCRRHKS
jgi:hypothetical protein